MQSSNGLKPGDEKGHEPRDIPPSRWFTTRRPANQDPITPMKTIPLFLLSLLLCGRLPAQDKTNDTPPATPTPAKRAAPAPLPDDVEKR